MAIAPGSEGRAVKKTTLPFGLTFLNLSLCWFLGWFSFVLLSCQSFWTGFSLFETETLAKIHIFCFKIISKCWVASHKAFVFSD